MKRISIFAFLFMVLACAPAQAKSYLPTKEEELIKVEYPRRLVAIHQIGQMYAGFQEAIGFEWRSLGIWGMVAIQTTWQQRSERSKLAHWRIPNTLLTLVPLTYLREYRDQNIPSCEMSPYALANPVRDPAHAPVSQIDVCLAWKNFFRLVDNMRPAKLLNTPFNTLNSFIETQLGVHQVLRHAYWVAHMAALEYGLWQYQDELDPKKLPELERQFWQGYVKLVRAFGGVEGPTNDFSKPVFRLLMPPCSPLGSPGCQLTDLSPASANFVNFLTDK